MRVSDPGLYALKAAARAAIVVPLALALTKVVIDDDQMALFAAFGSFAFLVFAEFGGPVKLRLGGYLGLAVTGCGLIALGTLCSDRVVLGSVAMALVGFAIYFGGALTGYVAAAQSAATLSFVLALMVPAGAGEIPQRLAGWGIAAALSIAAIFLLWPGRPRNVVRTGAAKALEALADLVEGGEEGERERLDAAARQRIRAVRADFVSLQHRPSGTGGRTAALARLVEDLGWLRRFAAAAPGAEAVSAPFAAERERIEAEAPALLRRCAGWLRSGVPGAPGLEPLRSAHADLGRAALAHVGTLTEQGPASEGVAARELDEVFRLRLLAFASTEIAETAQRALGARVDSSLELARDRVEAAGRVARAHASMHSVWLRNSLRAALGLSLAVLIAQLADLDHAFWVVLGTMSVLRSSALATSSTIAWALLGSLVGIVVGGLIVVAVDSSEAALWALLPFACLLAAYSPRAVSFAAGQAGFSVVVLILFNLLQPTGWEVGISRIEDVAIGAGVSLLVGAMLWPRGATAVLRESIGFAYERATAFLDTTMAALLGGVAPPPSLAREAFASGQLLDANIRDFLSDRSGATAPIEELTVLMAGARRVRQVANLLGHREVLAQVGPLGTEMPRVERERAALEAERDSICHWYEQLAAAVASAGAAPPPLAREASRPVALERVPGDSGVGPGVAIAWAGRYLDALAELEPALARAGDSLAKDSGPARRTQRA